MKNLKKGLGSGMRKWEGERGPSRNLAWVPGGLNPALLRANGVLTLPLHRVYSGFAKTNRQQIRHIPQTRST